MNNSIGKLRWTSFGMVAMVLIAQACASAGPGPGGTANTDSLVQARRFVFVPQSVNPTGGATRQLTADFFLRVAPDTVQSYLPYFGRAFTAPLNPSANGLDFTTTDFEYNVARKGNNRYDITIRPRSGTDVREMNLRVFSNGNATLQALSNNRQAISYNGHVRVRR